MSRSPDWPNPGIPQGSSASTEGRQSTLPTQPGGTGEVSGKRRYAHAVQSKGRRLSRGDLIAEAKQSLGARLREQRTAANRSGIDVASDIGISAGYLSDIERGKKLPSLEMLLVLASSLDTTVSDLIRGSSPWDSQFDR